jgi:nitrate reductase gamma subunit
MPTVLLWWIWLAAIVFVVFCGLKALKYARAPVHVRWDLYPVAHEPGREHGGSYLEQKDWWTKPRIKSHWGEATFMAAEIFWLHGVRENNRKLWRGSLPFHWGLYILLGVSGGLLVAGLGFAPALWLSLLAVGGAVGGILTAVGAIALLIIRSTDPKFRPYTSPGDRINLIILLVLGGMCAAVSMLPGGITEATAAVGRMLRLQAPEVSTLLAAQMAVAALFIFYLPFTRMVHFFSKYFTYHQVRWDDTPVEAGSALERKLLSALDFGVDWSAEHIKSTGKTWLEVATTLPKKDDGD